MAGESWQAAFQQELAKMDNKIWELFVREKQARENLKEELFSELRRETSNMKYLLDSKLSGTLPGSAGPIDTLAPQDWPAPRDGAKELARVANAMEVLTGEVAALEEELDAFRVRQRLQFIASGMLALCAPEFGSQDKINYMAGLGEEERDIQECLKKLEASKGKQRGDERLKERLGLSRNDDRFGFTRVMGIGQAQNDLMGVGGSSRMIHTNPAFQQAQQNMQQQAARGGSWSWFGNNQQAPAPPTPTIPTFIGSAMI
jgi:hypothetical protein